ncbi:hypothetical protein P7K49_021732 [Saguinus oedipus]|uniref:Uncharacterized protein n=1 Tax=Saguinus oedipus TaxID=9490 RepID=A0ABQ9UTG5_SAGOE|nr:hypothetical protein P7K49_021732 [Saguinus oedipus]
MEAESTNSAARRLCHLLEANDLAELLQNLRPKGSVSPRPMGGEFRLPVQCNDLPVSPATALEHARTGQGVPPCKTGTRPL